jgi:hypothetical protein
VDNFTNGQKDVRSLQLIYFAFIVDGKESLQGRNIHARDQSKRRGAWAHQGLTYE